MEYWSFGFREDQQKFKQKDLRKCYLGDIYLRNRYAFLGAGSRAHRFRSRLPPYPPLRDYRGPLQHALFREHQGQQFKSR